MRDRLLFRKKLPVPILALAFLLLPLLPQSNPDQLPLLILIIDFNDFMCPACLESILGFYNAIPLSIRDNNLWGIVVFGHNSKELSSLSKKIIVKKLNGFIQANQLKFPLIPDFAQKLKSSASEGSHVLIFNNQLPSLLKFSFPLKKSEMHKIISALNSE